MLTAAAQIGLLLSIRQNNVYKHGVDNISPLTSPPTALPLARHRSYLPALLIPHPLYRTLHQPPCGGFPHPPPNNRTLCPLLYAHYSHCLERVERVRWRLLAIGPSSVHLGRTASPYWINNWPSVKELLKAHTRPTMHISKTCPQQMKNARRTPIARVVMRERKINLDMWKKNTMSATTTVPLKQQTVYMTHGGITKNFFFVCATTLLMKMGRN